MTTPQGSVPAPVPTRTGLFLVSAAVLALQILQTRILSVLMWHHHSYMVVTMTLLGFAAAGSAVTVAPRLAGEHLRRTLVLSAYLFGLTTIAGFFVLSHTADQAAEMTAQGRYLALSLFYAYLLVPYFFAGLVVVCALTAARDVHGHYAVNLLGSAFGTWAFIAAVAPLGAERLLVLCAAMGPLAAATFQRGPGPARRSAVLLGATLLGGVVLFARAEDWLEIQVADTKSEHFVLEERASTRGAERVASRWSPLCRLDAVRLPEPDGVPRPMFLFQDGDAITAMHSDASWEHAPPLELNTLAYLPHAGRALGPQALVIGVGGGTDLRYALDQGARSVLGIELNPAMVDLVGRELADVNGHIFQREGVTVQVGEGRSTLRRLDEVFDVIQLSGTDTYTAGTSGAYVLSESYLYTAEAFDEYFAHLSEHGTLGVIRLAFDPPRENLRLFAIALEALRRRGVERPSRHAIVVYRETPDPEAGLTVRFAGSVFSNTPFPPEVVDAYRQADGLTYFRLGWYPGMEEHEDNEFTRLAAAIDAGDASAFYADYPWRVAPVVDDAPFFFHFHRWSDLDDDVEQGPDWYALTGGPIGLEILGSLLLQSSLLVAALVLLPLLALRRGGLAAPQAGRHLAFFLALGAAFMFLEISTAQRLVLFLGHPTYSLTVTLFAFLFFAGLGSVLARRLNDRGALLRRVTAALCLAIAAFALFLDSALDALLFLPLPLRVIAALALLAPMNVLMGMPFPMGLARLRRLAPSLVPWALGVNGGASVIGSVLCIVVAMEHGFRTVSLLALALYACGTWAVTSGPLSDARTRAALALDQEPRTLEGPRR